MEHMAERKGRNENGIEWNGTDGRVKAGNRREQEGKGKHGNFNCSNSASERKNTIPVSKRLPKTCVFPSKAQKISK